MSPFWAARSLSACRNRRFGSGGRRRTKPTTCLARATRIARRHRAPRAGRIAFGSPAEEQPPGSFEARCGGEASLHRVDALHRRRLAGPGIERRMGRLRRLLHERLAERERAFRVDRYDAPARRLTPPGATPSVPGVDEGQRYRLKALGYVQ